MRFDDSLDTVLAADAGSGFGVQWQWRQLIDLIGRRQAAPAPAVIARLWDMREQVPDAVRAASARAVAMAEPPVEIVRLFAADAQGIGAVVVRTARLAADEWTALLPDLSPGMRAVLRHRRDLEPAVERALAAYGAVDFVLGDAVARTDAAAKPAGPLDPVVADMPPSEPAPAPISVEPSVPPFTTEPAPLSPFVSFGAAAREVPIVAEALRAAPPAPTSPPLEGPFAIAELVARIEAYRRKRAEPGAAAAGEVEPAAVAAPPTPATTFRFETDAQGVVRWVEGVERGPLIGLSLDLAALPPGARVDGIAAGAFRRRQGFSDARLVVAGGSDAGGAWRISAVPAFDPASGRFTGYRGTARRPRSDETAEPQRPAATIAPDALRQLVHELRTPTNAIAGFAEMIERQLLGPVAASYRDRAGTIRAQAMDLLAAIDDLDLAARIEGRRLDLRTGHVPLRRLLDRIAADLEPLATLRGTTVAVDPMLPDIAVRADERGVERLIGRLVAALVAAGRPGERIGVSAGPDEGETVRIAFDRPTGLAAYADDALFAIDAETEAEAAGGPLLGTGFALRLVRNLAVELGGGLTIDNDRLTLRLPAAVNHDVGQASTN